MGFFDSILGSEKKKRKGVSPTKAVEIARGQGFKCKLCPASITKRYEYHIDHKDGDRSNDSASNLRALCVKCHSKTTHRQTKERAKKARRKRNDPFGLGFNEKTKTKKKTSKRSDPFGLGNFEV